MNFKINYSNRVYGLDLLRAIAIILVVHFHASFFLKDIILGKFPYLKSPDGVEIFFVLSGFLIGRILIKLMVNTNYRLSSIDMLTFWKRRWFRTLPNYYLILGLNLLLVKLSLVDINWESFNLRYLIFMQNFAWSITPFFRESWSLSIEEWFYLLFPIITFSIVSLWQNKKGLLLSLFVVIVLPLACRLYISTQEISVLEWSSLIRTTVICRLDTLIFGVLAAYVSIYYSAIWIKYMYYFFFVGLSVYVLLMLLPLNANSFFTKTFYFDINAISIALMLPIFDSIKNFKTFFGKIITHISLISYSMYLLNFSISLLLVHNLKLIENYSGYLVYIFFWLITLLLSTLLYFFFEKPMMELREQK